MNTNNDSAKIAQTKSRVGRIGIWSAELRRGDAGQVSEVAAELETLGYGALWIPGGGDQLSDAGRLLSATKTLTIATGILNIYAHDAKAVSAWRSALPADQCARFLLGLGVSHGPVVGAAYGKPLSAMSDYLALLSAEGVPADAMCLAALGPKMLELARERSAGALPYLVTTEHTAAARSVLGPSPLLAVEQGVVLDTDPDRAREPGRMHVKGYGRMPNYANSWRRLGFSEDDIANASDRLVDALFAWGDVDAIAARVNAHLAAGADHVCIQVTSGRPGQADTPALLQAWRVLAKALA